MLAGLEAEFAGRPFVVVGVHSPKFPTEGDVDAVRDAVRRYEVRHPVVVDTGHRVWETYAVRAWPTLYVVDPEGYVHAGGSGEPDPHRLAEIVAALLDEHADKGTLDPASLPIRLEAGVGGQLRYPSKVGVFGDLAIVSDTGHHRLFVGRLAGEALRVERVIGGPEAGFVEGPPETARFDHPYGTALAGETLYVADAGNHALRAVDLDTGQTRTVAGTGQKGSWPLRGGAGSETALRSPWDLAWDESHGRLYVAMAGSHQIWTYDPGSGRIEPFAGSGREARVDGPPAQAAFAQPSGLALSDDRLYVADAEISAVREIDLETGMVRTVCGGDLFDFGDRDGVGDEVRLQHVMGIAARDGEVLVADSYNHKVKRVSPATGECVTVHGNGRQGDGLDPSGAIFAEPEGLAVAADGSLLVADTNNHRLLRIAGGRGSVLLA